MRDPPPLPASPRQSPRSQTPPRRSSSSALAARIEAKRRAKAEEGEPQPEPEPAEAPQPAPEPAPRMARSKSWRTVRGAVPQDDERSGASWPTRWAPQCRSPIKGHEGAVNATATFRGGSRVLSAGADGKLRISDLAVGESIGSQSAGHDLESGKKSGTKLGVTGCCVIDDGDRALSCGSDGTLRLWSLRTGSAAQKLGSDQAELLETLDAHDAVINECCFFEQKVGEQDVRERALSCSDDKTLKVWELSTGTCIATLKGTDGDVKCCTVFQTANDRLQVLSGGADNHVRRWKLHGEEEEEYGREITQADGGPWMPKQDTLRGRDGHNGMVNGCAVSDDGAHALTCSGDRTAIYWDLGTGVAIQTLREGNSVNACCFLPGGDLALTASSFAPRLWDVHSGEILRTFAGHTGPVLNCEIAGAGSKAITCGEGGTVRVWDLSSHDNMQALGRKQEQHKHVVKELVMFPDGKRALSCSYDKTVKVWCLRTGGCLHTLEGHTGQVFECCVSPDGRKVLSAAKEMKIWDWEAETCELTFGTDKHSGKDIRGCGIFNDDGKRAFSCSKDTTVCIWEIHYGDGGTAERAECIRTLSGHTDLVDRCCVFGSTVRHGDRTHLISASWDKTCKVWDLSTGECKHTLQDDNKVRGVAVFDDDKKAVTVGSGKRLLIWDLLTGEMAGEIAHDHSATVWGLCMLDGTHPLEMNGVWRRAPIAATYSGDGTVKLWNLLAEAECEVVHGRRAFDPGPMCVAAVPPSYSMGSLPMLVGGFKSIKLFDLSCVGTGVCAGALWAGKTCVDPNSWTTWLMDAIKETSAHFLYSRERGADLPTLIHKLANDRQGHSVLDKVVRTYVKPRLIVVQGKPYNKDDHEKAVGTIGMLSRAGTSAKGSVLAVAVRGAHENMAELLLDDYCSHIHSYRFRRSKMCAPATMVCTLTEGDILHLFESFPTLAAEFLLKLPLQHTDLVLPDSKCDFTGAPNGVFVLGSSEHSPAPREADNGVFVQWWDDFIDDRWMASESGEDAAAKATKDGPPIDESNRLTFRRNDTAWGDQLKAERIPLKAGGFEALKANQDRRRERMQAQRQTSLEEMAPLVTEGDGKSAGMFEVVKHLTENLDLFGNEADKDEEITEPPFSRLLQTACEHATRTRSPEIFESDVLEAIIQHKWHSMVKDMYFVMVRAYVVYILIFTVVTLKFHDWITVEDWDSTEQVFAHWMAWILLGYALLYNLALIKHELHQMRADGITKYLSDPFNVIDTSACLLTTYTLQHMTWIHINNPDQKSNSQLSLDIVQAQAMICCWLKVLYFFRGLDETSFIVNMLIKIGFDMAPFLLVLAVVLIAFAASFFLLLRHDLFAPDDAGSGTPGLFADVAPSFLGAFEMMFGNFDGSVFRESPGSAAFAIIDFVLFMLIVPTIMLNALIAIMGDTYATVKEVSSAIKRQDRADVILELEASLMKYTEGAEMPTGPSFVMHTLLTIRMQYSNWQRYLHQLSPQEARGEEGDLEEQVQSLQSSFTFLSESMEDRATESERSFKRLENKLNEQHKEHKEELRALKEMLRGLSGQLHKQLGPGSPPPPPPPQLRPQPQPQPEPEPEPEPSDA